MRSENLTVVIIKNYPLVVEFYRELLNEFVPSKQRYGLRVKTAFNYHDALDLFDRLRLLGKGIDLVVIDLKVPDYTRKGYWAGEDIGQLVRENFPDAKLIITTAFKNNYRINSILKSIKPEGILVKSDVDIVIFRRAILEVLNDSVYYSRSILKWLNTYRAYEIVLDKWDRRLLYELSQNVKMKDLPEKLPLSLAAIEKRKRRIKVLFGVEEGDNYQLLLKARKYGFI